MWSQSALTLSCAIDRPPALNFRISLSGQELGQCWYIGMDTFHVWNLVHLLAGLAAGWTKTIISVLCTHKCTVKAFHESTTACLTRLSGEVFLSVRRCRKCQHGCRTKATKMMEYLNRDYFLCTGLSKVQLQHAHTLCHLYACIIYTHT